MTAKQFLKEVGYPVESKHRIIISIKDLCLIMTEFKNYDQKKECEYEVQTTLELISKP